MSGRELSSAALFFPWQLHSRSRDGPAAALAREVLRFPVISALFLAALLAVEANRLRILRELRASARTLHASEQRFRGVFEEAAVGIAVLDCNGRFLSVNKAVTEITQYTAAELVGQDFELA